MEWAEVLFWSRAVYMMQRSIADDMELRNINIVFAVRRLLSN